MSCCQKSPDSICQELKAINHIIQRKMTAVAMSSGADKITVMHGWIMGYLYSNKDRMIFQKDIESEFAISSSTVTHILKLMEKKGYIQRKSVENDARLKRITLTSEGEAIHKSIQKNVRDEENRLDSILTEDERLSLINLLRKLRSGINTEKGE